MAAEGQFSHCQLRSIHSRLGRHRLALGKIGCHVVDVFLCHSDQSLQVFKTLIANQYAIRIFGKTNVLEDY